MAEPRSTIAHRVAQAASNFQKKRTGHVPKAVTVVLGDDTRMVTLNAALTSAAQAVATNPASAAPVQGFHRQLFANSSHVLREEIRRPTGVQVREAAAEVEAGTGTVGARFHQRHDGPFVPAGPNVSWATRNGNEEGSWP